MNNLLDRFFGEQIRELAENDYGYVKGQKYKDLHSEYENLFIKLKEAEDFKDKYNELSASYDSLNIQNQDLTQKYDNLDTAFNKLKNENVLIYAKAKANHQKVQNMFMNAMSETLKFRLITPQTFDLLSPESEIQITLNNDSELSERFTSLIESYKSISSELYEKLKTQTKQAKQSELNEKELGDKVGARRKLFVDLNLNNVIFEITPCVTH